MTLASSALALLLSAPPIGHASVATRLVAPARLTVGDPFEVSFVLRARRPSLVTGPLPDSLGPLVIVDERRSTKRRGDDDETTYRVRAACFRPGRLSVPRFTFLVTAGARTDTLRTDTLSVTVASVLPASLGDIHPLKPAEDFPNWAPWLLAAAAVLLAALAWWGRRLLRRLRAAGELETPALPPWEEALASLDGLPWREWLAEGQAKRFYYALSEILKRYMERRFEFAAVEQTTTEILASMRAGRVPMRDEMTRFFARYDLVKYGKWVPPVEESEQAIAQVREFVMQTRPAEPSPAPGAPALATAGAAATAARANAGGP